MRKEELKIAMDSYMAASHIIITGVIVVLLPVYILNRVFGQSVGLFIGVALGTIWVYSMKGYITLLERSELH